MPTITRSPLIDPKFQAFYDDGRPLDGGFLYSYIAGTNTPQDTYPDSTTGAANPNPVELDSAGRANVFVLPLPYKFVLKDSDGNTIWTEDYIDQSGVIGGPTAFVIAQASTPAAFASGVWTNMFVNSTVHTDTLSNFNFTLGVFTAGLSGLGGPGNYVISYSGDLNLNSATFTSGYVQVFLNSAPLYTTVKGAQSSFVEDGAGRLVGAGFSIGVTLAAGDQIEVGAKLTFTGGPPQVDGSILTITRA